VRPTSDRVREALFARLGDLAGTAVLDLYAGTGALGVEAASRGAERVVFVENAPHALRVLRANLEALGLAATTRVVAGDAAAAVRRLAREGLRFDLVLMDPPYAGGEAARGLAALAEADLLEEAGLVVVEHGRRHPLPSVAGLVTLDERRYGDTLVTRLARQRPSEPGAAGGTGRA
jgi:16S rRNA (guanine966-N2)-methyltransferase